MLLLQIIKINLILLSLVLNIILIYRLKMYSKLKREEFDVEENTLEISDTYVKEIMTARTSIFAIEKNKKISEVIDEIIENGFSRIPIYDETIDNIVGLLYIKDLLKSRDKDEIVSSYMRDILYIPETKLISKLLEEFKKDRKHLAIIIDEYGCTSGLVTIEDILEEIVGEIRDEYDIEVDDIVKISENIYEIQGETLVDDVISEINIEIPISDDYDTISGYVQYISGKVPEINEQITTDDYAIKILELENKRIKKIKLILLNLGGYEND